MKNQARVVVIGGGITGCSIAYHLAKMGWRDIVLVEKGELTSGTTFHSVGLVSQFRTSNALMQLQNYSIALFNEFKREVGDALGWYQVGSLRLASSPDQLKNLKRNVSRAKGLGLNVEVISAAEAKGIFPPMTDATLYGAVHIPDDGWLDPNGITVEFARRAKQLGAEIHTGVRVTGIEASAKGEVRAVQTTHGRIATEIVVNAAGEWAPRIAQMLVLSNGEGVGVNVPMVPLMHQYMLTKAIAGHELPKQTPVVRDPDNLFYLREEARGFLIGGFETNPKAWATRGVPWEFTQQLLPPDWDLFQPVLDGAMRRVPILRDAEITKLINGPEAITPDGHYALGPVPSVRGFWVAAGMSLNGIAGAGGVGRVMAEWIIDGHPSIDVSEMNVRRFGEFYRDVDYVTERAREIYKHYYFARYPNDEDEWARGKRLSPLYERMKDFGAVFGAKNGWERVNYFDVGTLRASRRAGLDQRAYGWNRPPYFERVGVEHRAVRERVALFDMTSFGKIDVTGRGALALLQKLADNDIDKPIGSLTYAQFLNPRGGIEADLTIARLGADAFRIITGTACAAQDLGWLHMHATDDVEIRDVTEEYACVGLWGPNARRVLEQVAREDVSNAAFPYMSAKNLVIGPFDPAQGKDSAIWAQRVSYVGELGWELYIGTKGNEGTEGTEGNAAIRVWDALYEAGKPFGIEVAGYKALDSLRLEKCYRAWGADITPSENPYESGQGFCVRLNKNDGSTDSPQRFIGRDALVKAKAQGLTRWLCTLTLTPTPLPGGEGIIYGGEAIYADERVVSRVRSGGYGYTVQKNIALCYLPLELARVGTTVYVDVFGERVPAVVEQEPLYDPRGEKLRA